MIIKRDRYLNKLIERKENGMVKVITGIRRCGKSFLLNNIYKEYLLSIGIKTEQIIQLALDQDRRFEYLRVLGGAASRRALVGQASRKSTKLVL